MLEAARPASFAGAENTILVGTLLSKYQESIVALEQNSLIDDDLRIMNYHKLKKLKSIGKQVSQRSLTSDAEGDRRVQKA